MIWRSPRPVLSLCGSIQQHSTALRRRSGLLCHHGIRLYPHPALSAPKLLLKQFSSKESSPNTIHDVASALRIASEEPLPITVLSTVRTVRKQKKHSFAKLGDGSTTSELQVLLSSAQAEGLSTGTAVKVVGTLQPSPPGLQQSHEVHANEVTIIGASDPETYPIQKKYHTPEYLRTLPHLRLRTPRNGLIARLRSEVEYHCSEWFHQHGYIRTHPPIITSSDCEGAGEVFTVTPASKDPATQEDGNPEQHFFRDPKYLTVSSQLHLEAYVHAHRAVWTLSPTFRAERSDTPRHLSEFYMLEAEIQTTSLGEVMDVVESLLRHIGSSLSQSPLGQELLSYANKTPSPNEDDSASASTLASRWSALQSPSPYPRITYTAAISHLENAAASKPTLFTHPVSWGISLALEHEKYLAATIGNGTTPIFVTDYPAAIKPFYMPPSELSQNPQPHPEAEGHSQPLQPQPQPPPSHPTSSRETVSSFDLLLPSIAELAGGSLREHRQHALEAAIRHKGISPAALEWYLGLRRYGSVPHGGFGLGFDRLLCFLAGEASVRDVVPWPRWVGRCDG